MMYMGSDLLQCFTSSTILRAEFIVTLNICFYFIPCRTTRPKHAKLHLNGTVQSNTELDKTNFPLYSSSGVVFGQRERNGNEMEKKRKCSINILCFKRVSSSFSKRFLKRLSDEIAKMVSEHFNIY